MKKRTRNVLLGLAAALLIGLAALGLVLMAMSGMPSKREPDWTLADLTLRDSRVFDARRAAAFKRAVEVLGARCDEVTKMVMSKPGLWLAECSPGYRYRLTLREDMHGDSDSLVVDRLP